MFKLIVQKELKEIIGSTKFSVTFAVCAVLILLAFYVGARNYQVSRQEYDASRAEDVRQMEGLTEWRQVDHRVFLPPQPLAVLVSGISNDVGRTIEMRTRGELRAEDSRFNEDPIYAVFRFLDLEFIFTVVLSLFAILFAYDAVNGEKERGTLRLSFANAVPRDQYILGKLTGSFLALVVPLLVPVLIGCVMLSVMGVPMRGEEWLRLGMVLLAGVLYFGVFLTLSVLVSVLTQRSSTSFLLLLVIWIFAVLIIPRTAVIVAGRMVDVPSIDQVNYEKTRYARQIDTENRKQIQEFFSQPHGDDMQKVMAEFNQQMKQMRDERDEKVRAYSEQRNEVRENRDRVRQRVALGISRISPTAAFSLAASSLAGTSLDLQESFREAGTVYQSEYRQFIESKTEGQGGFRITIGEQQDEDEPEPIDPQELPAFQYQTPPAGRLIESSLIDIGLLFFFNVIFFAGAFVGFLRYDVR